MERVETSHMPSEWLMAFLLCPFLDLISRVLGILHSQALIQNLGSLRQGDEILTSHPVAFAILCVCCVGVRHQAYVFLEFSFCSTQMHKCFIAGVTCVCMCVCLVAHMCIHSGVCTCLWRSEDHLRCCSSETVHFLF